MDQTEAVQQLLDVQVEEIGLHQGHAGLLIGRHWQLPEIVVTVMQFSWLMDYRGQHWELARTIGLVSKLLRSYQQTHEVPDVSPELCELLAIDADDTAAQLTLLPDLYEDLERVAGHLAKSMG